MQQLTPCTLSPCNAPHPLPQRFRAGQEGRSRAALDAAERARQSAAAAGRSFLLAGYQRTIASAIVIQRAFRAFRARCVSGGGWPSETEEGVALRKRSR